MASTVTTTGTLVGLESNIDTACVFTPEAGKRVVVYKDDAFPHGFKAKVTTDGSTWGAEIDLALTDTPLTLGFDGTHLTAFVIIPGGLPIIGMVQWTWTGTTFSAPTESGLVLYFKGAATCPGFLTSGIMAVTAIRLASTWHFALAVTCQNGQKIILFVAKTDGYAVALANWMTYGATDCADLCLASVGATTLYLAASVPSQGKVLVYSYAFLDTPLVAPTGFTLNAAQVPDTALAVSGALGQVACANDQAGSVDVVVRAGTTLFHAKRLGSTNWSTPVSVAQAVSDTTSFAMTYNPGNAALNLYYRSLANNANGEIYVALRTGAWSTPLLLAGGDGTVYSRPSAPLTISGSAFYLVYMHGTTVEERELPASSAPSKPTITAPTANQVLTTQTPTITFLYANDAPDDAQGAYRIIIVNDADNTVLWDSGWIASADTSVVVGTPLPWGTTCRVTVQTKDSLSNSGAGTASPVSNPVLFKTQQPSTVVIVSIDEGGTLVTASPVTLTSAVVAGTLSYDSPDGDAANSVQMLIRTPAGVLIEASPLWTPGTDITSPSDYTTPTWTLDSARYAVGDAIKIVLATTDAVTGMVSESPAWDGTIEWTPPAPVATLVAVNDDFEQQVGVYWPSDPAITGFEVQRQEPDGTWLPLDTRVDSPLIDFPPPLVPTTYRVRATNIYGLVSDWTLSNPITLGLRFDRDGVSVVDCDDPTIKIVLGGINSWTALQIEGVQEQSLPVSFGEEKPRTIWRTTDYDHSKTDMDFFLPSRTADGTNTVTALDIIASMNLLWHRKNKKLLRLPSGESFYITLKSRIYGPYEKGVGHYTLQFSWTQDQDPQKPLTA